MIKAMSVTLISVLGMISVLAGCLNPDSALMRGTEVGNGARTEGDGTPDSDRIIDPSNNSGDDEDDRIVPTGERFNSDLILSLLGSSCHSLIQSSGAGGLQELVPYAGSFEVTLLSSSLVGETRHFFITNAGSGGPGEVKFGNDLASAQAIERGNMIGVSCVGAESVAKSKVSDRTTKFVLDSTVKIARVSYKIRLERLQSASESILERVHLTGPRGFRIEWVIKR